VVSDRSEVILMHERMIIINELAQARRSITFGVRWFGAMTDSEQLAVLEEIVGYYIQARATTDDVPEAIRRAGLKSRPFWPPNPLIRTSRPGRTAAIPSASVTSTFRQRMFSRLS
jgi:hypothetical protein